MKLPDLKDLERLINRLDDLCSSWTSELPTSSDLEAAIEADIQWAEDMSEPLAWDDTKVELQALTRRLKQARAKAEKVVAAWSLYEKEVLAQVEKVARFMGSGKVG